MKSEPMSAAPERNTVPVPFHAAARERRADFDVDYVLDAVRQAENAPELRVAAYIRVSTDFLDQENSYRTQEQYFHRMITSNSRWRFVGVYSDYGLSGTGTEDRIGFRRLIRHCKEGKIDRIVCKSISRFARNTADFSQTMLLLRSWHVTILFEKENLDSAELQNEFILSVLGAFAQEESRSISSNVKDGIRMNMSQGNVPNVALYGYRFTEHWLRTENGYEYREVEVVPEEAAVVRLIFEKAAAGRHFTEIARYLNAQGFPAPDSSYNRLRKKHSRKGQLNSDLEDGWKAAQISKMVRNERYVGAVLTQKTFTSDYLTHKVKANQGELHQYYIENHHPAIVDRTLYEQVQQVLAARARKQAGHDKRAGHPFARRIVCGVCGRFYCGSVQEGAKKWHCPTAARNNGLRLCDAERIGEETIRFVLCEAVLRDSGLDGAALWRESEAGGPDTRKQVQALFRAMRHRLEKILKDDSVERVRSRYKGQLAEIEEALEWESAEMRSREHPERTPLRKNRRALEKKYQDTARKLRALEEYWRELECDHELRTEALQWMRGLPPSKTGLEAFLQGVTGSYFRAFVLELTVCQQKLYRIRWFDNRCTEVKLEDRAEEGKTAWSGL